MSVNDLVQWCEQNSISKDIPLTFDRGIDLIEHVARCISNDSEIILLGEGYDEAIITA